MEFPEDAVLYVARADVERDMKHDDLALVDLDEAIRLAPDSIDAISLGVPPADVHEQMQQCK